MDYWELGLLVAFALPVLFMIHSLLLYPLSLFILGKREKSNDLLGKQGEDFKTHDVSLVIAAYNEEDIIAKKIRNSLQLDYPAENLDIIVFSDASTDATDSIVRSFSSEGVNLIRYEGRIGKTECQNKVMTEIDTDIVVFSDANSMYDPDAIKNLVSKFGPNVGCVVGELRYEQKGEKAGESFYWKYEQLIKRLESDFGSLTSANGAIYSVKQSSYQQLPSYEDEDLAEVFAIVSNNETVKYCEEAVAWEVMGKSIKAEYKRKVRMATRSWQTIVNYMRLFNPVAYSKYAYQLVSRTILRWLMPLWLILAFFSNLFLILLYGNDLYGIILFLQISLYLSALVGWAINTSSKVNSNPFEIPYYFILTNKALLFGLWNFLTGNRIITWETSER